MTTLSPEDRARAIIEAFKGQTFSETDDAYEWLQRQISGAIKDGIADRLSEIFLTASILQSAPASIASPIDP
jgi:hypothetical protein